MPAREHLVRRSEEIASEPTRHGTGQKKNFFGSGELEGSYLVHADLSSLGPGESIAPHAHESKEETYYFISGNGYMSLNEERFPVGQSGFVWVAAKTIHSLENTGAEPLTFVIHGVEGR